MNNNLNQCNKIKEVNKHYLVITVNINTFNYLIRRCRRTNCICKEHTYFFAVSKMHNSLSSTDNDFRHKDEKMYPKQT